jgi:hypothetical protein
MPGGDLQPDPPTPPTPPPTVQKRSAATWAKLLAVWGVGLVSWTIYLVAILYLWIRFLG